MQIKEEKSVSNTGVFEVTCEIVPEWVIDEALDGIAVKWQRRIGKLWVDQHEEVVMMPTPDTTELSSSYTTTEPGSWRARVCYVRTSDNEQWLRMFSEFEYTKPKRGAILSSEMGINKAQDEWTVSLQTSEIEVASIVQARLQRADVNMVFADVANDSKEVNADGTVVLTSAYDFSTLGLYRYRVVASVIDAQDEERALTSNILTINNLACLATDTPLEVDQSMATVADVIVGSKVNVKQLTDQPATTDADWAKWSTDDSTLSDLEVTVTKVVSTTVPEYLIVNDVKCSLDHLFWAMSPNGQWSYVPARFLDTKYKLMAGGVTVDITELRVVFEPLEVVQLNFDTEGLFEAGPSSLLSHSLKVKGS